MNKNQYIIPEVEVVRVIEELNILSQVRAGGEQMDPEVDEGW